MAKWFRELNLTPEWGRAQSGDITSEEMAGVISKRLSAMRQYEDAFIDEERLELADNFRDLSEGEDVDDFNDIMDRLYDWGDAQISGEFFNAVKTCWVKTQ